MKLGKKNIDNREIILHSIFWFLWIVSFTFIQSLGEGTRAWFVWLMYYVITLPVFIAHTYLIAYWLVPETFFKRKYLHLALGFLILLIFFSVIELIVSNELVFKVFAPEKAFSPGYLNLQNILISGVGNHYIILVFLAIKAGRSWYSAESMKEQLMQTKMETELEIYRYQLQPKMILTLIQELEKISSEKQEVAPEMIVKISNFLNRFLFEGKEALIPLQLEVKLMDEFFEIHKQALGEKLTSNFIVSGNIKPIVIPPLLLLPFINSAIKLMYECNNSFESTVIIKAEKKYLLYSFSFWSESEFNLADDENSEITRRRLNYSFPGKHRLVENIDNNFREFSLEIFI
ncbi:MAG: histidine kinase [Bacteroidota bacterium]